MLFKYRSKWERTTNLQNYKLADYRAEILVIYRKLEEVIADIEVADDESADFFHFMKRLAGQVGQACGAAKKRLKMSYFLRFLIAAKENDHDITVTHAKKIAKVFMPGRSSISEKVLIQHAGKPKRTAANKSEISLDNLLSSELFINHFTEFHNAEEAADLHKTNTSLAYQERKREILGD
jgi:hypothetical protein